MPRSRYENYADNINNLNDVNMSRARQTYIIVLLDELHNVGRVVSELADRAALNQLTQFTVNWDLRSRHGKDNGDLRLGDLVRQLTYRRIVLHAPSEM